MECPVSEVEVEPIPPISEPSFEKNEEFFLFSSIFEANMIDKRLVDKPLQFELSIGNAGNSLDGHSESVKRPQDLETDELGN
jgi:otoferlin